MRYSQHCVLAVHRCQRYQRYIIARVAGVVDAGAVDTGDQALFRIFIDSMAPAITLSPVTTTQSPVTTTQSPVTTTLAIIYCWCQQ
jgi:hypothetical protein